MDAKTQQYLQRQTGPHREIIDEIRSLILTHFPSIRETGMGEGLWYEGIFYIATVGGHVNLGVGIQGLSQDDPKHFQGKGKTQRHLKFYTPDDVQPEKLLPLLRLVYQKNISRAPETS
ncbi:MAG: DUF1801 domain-containing protein [Anaerolineaceae bacterium]